MLKLPSRKPPNPPLIHSCSLSLKPRLTLLFASPHTPYPHNPRSTGELMWSFLDTLILVKILSGLKPAGDVRPLTSAIPQNPKRLQQKNAMYSYGSSATTFLHCVIPPSHHVLDGNTAPLQMGKLPTGRAIDSHSDNGEGKNAFLRNVGCLRRRCRWGQ